MHDRRQHAGGAQRDLGKHGRRLGLSAGLGSPTVTNNFVKGNYIGTDITGSVPLPNGGLGIGVYGLANTVGGAGPGEGNVISGNQGSGIEVIGGSGSVDPGNLIGTDGTGTLPLGNNVSGIIRRRHRRRHRRTAPGEGNVIAFNGGGTHAAIAVSDGTGPDPRQLDPRQLAASASTSTDRRRQRPTTRATRTPEPTSSRTSRSSSGRSTGAKASTRTGVLHSTPSTTFDLDFYSNPACSDSRAISSRARLPRHRPGRRPTARERGFRRRCSPPRSPGARITATATDPAGNTSEFSQRLPFSIRRPRDRRRGARPSPSPGPTSPPERRSRSAGARGRRERHGALLTHPPRRPRSRRARSTTSPSPTRTAAPARSQGLRRRLPGRAARSSVLPVRHEARLERDHCRHRRRQLRRRPATLRRRWRSSS